MDPLIIMVKYSLLVVIRHISAAIQMWQAGGYTLLAY